MSPPKINSPIKAVKDEINTKMTNRLPTLRLLQLPLFRKSGGETISAVNTKKLWLGSWCFPSRKSPDCHPRTGFCTGRSTKYTPKPLSRSPWRRKVSLCLFTVYCPSRPIFALREDKVWADWPLAVPEQLQDKSRGEHLNLCQRWVRWCLLVVDRLLRKIRPLWL
jgi:hypothetical protein